MSTAVRLTTGRMIRFELNLQFRLFIYTTTSQTISLTSAGLAVKFLNTLRLFRSDVYTFSMIPFFAGITSTRTDSNCHRQNSHHKRITRRRTTNTINWIIGGLIIFASTRLTGPFATAFLQKDTPPSL